MRVERRASRVCASPFANHARVRLARACAVRCANVRVRAGRACMRACLWACGSARVAIFERCLITVTNDSSIVASSIINALISPGSMLFSRVQRTTCHVSDNHATTRVARRIAARPSVVSAGEECMCRHKLPPGYSHGYSKCSLKYSSGLLRSEAMGTHQGAMRTRLGAPQEISACTATSSRLGTC